MTVPLQSTQASEFPSHFVQRKHGQTVHPPKIDFPSASSGPWFGSKKSEPRTTSQVFPHFFHSFDLSHSFSVRRSAILGKREKKTLPLGSEWCGKHWRASGMSEMTQETCGFSGPTFWDTSISQLFCGGFTKHSVSWQSRKQLDPDGWVLLFLF